MDNGFSLYQLTSDYKKFTEMLENGEIAPEDIQDTLDTIAEDINTKLENTVSYIKDMRAQADAMAKAKNDLDERIKQKKKAIERLENYLAVCMRSNGFDKYESTNHRVTLRPSSAVVITDEHLLMSYLDRDYPDAIRITEKRDVDKKALAKILEEGGEIGGAIIEHRLNPQIK